MLPPRLIPGIERAGVVHRIVAADDFARSHPGGALGRKLLTHVSDVMRQGDDVPRVGVQAGLMELMRVISAKGLGMSAIVDQFAKGADPGTKAADGDAKLVNCLIIFGLFDGRFIGA